MHLEKGFKALQASWNSNTADQNVKLSLMLWIATQKVNTNVSSLSLALEIFCSNLSTLKINWQPIEKKFFKGRFPFVLQASIVQSEVTSGSVVLKMASSVFISACQDILECKWISTLVSRRFSEQKEDTCE